MPNFVVWLFIRIGKPPVFNPPGETQMGLFSNFSQFASLLKWLGQVDPADIGKVKSAVAAIQSEASTLQEQVQAALVIADVATDYIPGDFDDAVVDAISSLVNRDDVWLMLSAANIVDDGLADATALADALAGGADSLDAGNAKALIELQDKNPDGCPVRVAGADKPKMIPWPVIVQLSFWAIKVIKAIREKRNG